MAAAINDALGIDTDIIVGSRGQFDVTADGELIFSKQTEERFPEHDEIIAAIRSLSSTSA